MKVAIASGKGGTGKTTVATNLACVAAQAGLAVVYADCDVEEPNGHLFLKPAIEAESLVNKQAPEVDAEKCVVCGECARFCRFNAIICVGSRVVIYPELCHACGGCMRVCQWEAIRETAQEIGRVHQGRAGQIHFVQGMLRVGESQSPPVVRAVKAAVPPADLVLLDAPPGASCPVVETVRETDFLLLVAEPTPFGLHDLRLHGHFGGCREFTLVQADPEQRKIISIRPVTPPPHAPGVFPRWLREQGASVIIVGGIGQRAITIFAQEGIEVRPGEPDATVEALAAAYLNGQLMNEPQGCAHHHDDGSGHHQHQEGHCHGHE